MNWAYFVRDVIYRCCHWLNWHFYYGNDNSFFLCVYHVLHKLTEKSLTSCSEVGTVLLYDLYQFYGQLHIYVAMRNTCMDLSSAMIDIATTIPGMGIA